MASKKLSIRGARMELEFAILGGDKQKVAEAEKQLQQALMQATQKKRTAMLRDNRPQDDTSSS